AQRQDRVDEQVALNRDTHGAQRSEYSAKEQLTEAAFRVLDVREYHSEKTLAELYDPDLMPDDLRLAHQELDELVDAVYRKRSFDNDEERLSYLFGMYEQMTAEEKRK
ncbi:type IIL restriction-modification enzyme MmeI, partial [Agromyces bauzanensis]